MKSSVTGNDDEGLAAEQGAPGEGNLTLRNNDFQGNGNVSLDLAGIELENVGSLPDE